MNETSKRASVERLVSTEDHMGKPTFNDACEAVAQSLREFGYPDASAQMVSDTYDAMRKGNDIPHGIIGAFAAEQIKGERELFDVLSANAALTGRAHDKDSA